MDKKITKLDIESVKEFWEAWCNLTGKVGTEVLELVDEKTGRRRILIKEVNL